MPETGAVAPRLSPRIISGLARACRAACVRAIAAGLIGAGLAWFAGRTVAAADATPPPARPTLGKRITEARNLWQADAAKIRDLLAKLKTLVQTLTGLESKISRLRADIRKLEGEREAALDEMRQGLFCSGCMKTRAQIVASGDTFPHQGQRSIPASPEQIKQCEDTYDGRLDPLRQQLKTAQNDERQRLSDLQAAHHALNVQIPAYHRDIAQEQDLRQSDWGGEKDVLEDNFDDLESPIADAESAVRDGPAEERELRQANVRILQKQLADAVRGAEGVRLRAQQQADAFVRAATASLKSLGELASPLPHKFGLPGGWFLNKLISIPPRAVACQLVGIRKVAGAAAGETANDLRDAPTTSKNTAPPRPSMKDFLEGK